MCVCVCVCIHAYSSEYRGQLKEIKKKWGAAVNAAWQGNLSACHRFTSLGLGLPNSLFPSGFQTITV